MAKILMDVSDDLEYCEGCDYIVGGIKQSECQIFGYELYGGLNGKFYKCQACIDAIAGLQKRNKMEVKEMKLT